MNYLEDAIRKTVEGARPDKQPAEFVYVFTPDVFSTEKRFKVGWSSDWIAREKGLRTACPTGRMAYVLPCENGRRLEARIFRELKASPTVHVIGEMIHGLDIPVLRHLLESLKSADDIERTTVTQHLRSEPQETPAPEQLPRVSRAHAREVLISKKDTSPNEFYYRHLDDETTKKTGPWEEAELRLLHDTVAVRGAKQWGLIAREIPGRVGYQCRGAYNGAAYKRLFAQIR
jgi:hypothetical protein